MYQSISLPLNKYALDEYEDWAALQRELAALGCHGLEAIGDGETLPDGFPVELIIGYHLLFFPDWLDFYREDRPALERKFGNMEIVRQFYGGLERDILLERYYADLKRAASLNAKYVVFHVSDISIEEGYTYRWLHRNAEVIDTAVEVINILLDGQDWPFEFLLENQWWPGFTFTNPRETAQLLDGIHYSRKGILLDIGHLMNTNTSLQTQAEGADYIQAMLNQHGSLSHEIKGVHLYQFLSGAYVKLHTGFLPPLSRGYLERFQVSYDHILKIDQHQPWTDPAILPVLEQIAPQFLTHELTSKTRKERADGVATQHSLLFHSGLCHIPRAAQTSQ